MQPDFMKQKLCIWMDRESENIQKEYLLVKIQDNNCLNILSSITFKP